MTAGLRVEGLGKRYPNGNVALSDVSLSVEPGTFLVLLGPSGSGKTTMLRIVAGIERASEGQVTVGPTVVCGPGRHLPPERRNLSMVFQDYALWPHLRARDNVAYALRRTGLSRSDRQARAVGMLARVGLGALTERFPGELSGGEQQRVALARALVADVGLVLCDEPLSNLDADLRERMRIEISTLIREAGATAVYITHDQAEAFALADRVGVLDRGRLVQFGTPEDIYDHPADTFVARFTGTAGELDVTLSGPPGERGLVEVQPVGLSGTRPVRARAAAGLAGGNGLLVVRPGAVGICAPDDPARHAVGRVADVAFRGRGYEAVVDLGSGCLIRNVSSEQRPDRGRSVGLRFDPAGTIVFGTPGEQPVLSPLGDLAELTAVTLPSRPEMAGSEVL